MQEDELFPDRIWGALKALTEAPTHPLRNTSFQKGRSYQLLEIAVGVVMALLRPDFQWEVTPIQGDQGIDFLGVQRLFQVEGLELASYQVVAGQCKRSKSKLRLEKELSHDVLRMTEVAKPSHIILAVAAETSEDQQDEAREWFANYFHRQFTLFGLEELDLLFRRHLQDLVPLFEEGLEPDQSAEVIDHFSSPSTQAEPIPTIKVRSPGDGATGVPFEVHLDFEITVSVEEEIFWKWLSPKLVIAGSEVATLRIVSPVAADRPPGQPLPFDSSLRATNILRLIGYVTGAQSLGKAVVTDRNGGVLASVELGTIDLADQNTPPFYWEPFKSQADQFTQLWDRVKSGVPVGIAVTGSGGAGKTRLCEEFGYQATRDEGRYHQVAHPKAYDWPYRIFADLLSELAGLRLASESPVERVLDFIASRNTKLADNVTSTVQLVFRHAYAENSPEAFDEEKLIQLMCFVILENSRQQPLLIHIADCHWGQFSSLNLLAAVMGRLQRTHPSSLTRVLFIFEGRVGEALPEAQAEVKNRNAAPWEQFITNHLDSTIHISPLSGEQSGEFLEYVFESSETPHRRVPRSLLVRQNELKREIIRYSKGNPFHIVEQINLLRQEGTIARNERTGLFYLAAPLARTYGPPQSVEALIRLRLDYLKEKSPETVLLLAALAFVKDRVSRDLFRHLRLNLAPEVSLGELVASEFLEGTLEESREITFRHENYYRVAHRYPLQQTEHRQIIRAYLEWFERPEHLSPQSQFERALVLQRAENPETEEIQELLESVLDESERQQTHELSIQALENLIASYPDSCESGPIPVFESVQDCRLQLSRLMTLVANWAEAASVLQGATEDFEHAFETRRMRIEERRRLEMKYFSARIELADAKKNQLRHHEAIDILSDVLPEIELRCESDRPVEDLPNDWMGLALWARDRHGVALWFDGRLEEGRAALREGLRLARAVGDSIAEYNFLLDYGTALFHDEPGKGVMLLSEALEIVRREDVSTLPRDEYILEWQRCLGELLVAFLENPDERTATTREICQEVQRIYLDAERGGYTHETGGSALLLGSCKAWLEEESARRWLLRAISIAQRSSYLEYLWKGHLNLAQFLLSQSPSEVEGAAHHAEQVQHLLAHDLQQRRRREARRPRRRLLRLPLAQLARIWRTIGDSRYDALMSDHPRIEEYFSRDGEIRNDRWSSKQVLHISLGPNDYFLMN